MDEQKFEKTLKDVKWFSIIILVLVLIMFFINLSSGALKGLAMITTILQIALLLGTIIGCNNRMMYGPVCGVIVAILMILALNLIDIILGIIYLIECINLIKYMKN